MPAGGIVVCHDITERKRAERALGASEVRFRALAETAHDAIISAESRGRITNFNRGTVLAAAEGEPP